MADFARLSDARLLDRKQGHPQQDTIDPEKRKGKLSHSSITIDEFVDVPDHDKIKADPEQVLRLKKFFKLSESETFLYDDTCEWLNYGEFSSAQSLTPSSTPSTPELQKSDEHDNNNNLLRSSKDSDFIDIKYGKICVTSNFVLFFQGDVMKLPVDGIVKEDTVSIQKRGKKVLFESDVTWQTKYLVLTQFQLQIYDSIECKKDYMVRAMIPLSDIHSVTKFVPTTDSKKKHGFQVLTSRKMHTFGCESSTEATSWIEAIKSRIAKEESTSASVEVWYQGMLLSPKILLPMKSITEIAKIQHSLLYPKSIRISTTYGYQFVFSMPSFLAAYTVIHDRWKKLPQVVQPAENPKSNLNTNEDFKYQDPNSSTSQEFRKLFGLPETERLINDYHCSLMSTAPIHGRLFISPNHLSFRSTGVLFQKKFVIPLRQITKVEVLHFRHTFYFKPLKVTTRDNEFIFCDFFKRKEVLQLLNRLMAIVHNSQPAVSASPLLSADHWNVTPSEVSTAKRKNLNITILIIGSRGDVQPFISFALGLQKEGHRVRIASHTTHKSFIESWGINFAPLAGDPKDLMRLMVNNESMLSVSFMKEALGNFVQFIEELLWSAWLACSDENFKPDVIIQNPPTMAGPHIAEALNIPLFCSFTMPWSRTSSFPHPFAIPSVPCGPAYNYSSYIAVEEAMFFPIREKFSTFRKKLSLPELDFGSGHSIMHDRQVPFLYCWSPSVLKKPADWPDFIHVTGYWFLDAPLNWSPSPELVKFINQEPKPVYIGFGSITVDDPDELTNSIINALRETGLRAVLVKGWGGLADITYPDNIFALDSVPHDWLFPQMSAVIHHGGAGTTAAGLRAGVPTLIVPFFGDQFFWGQRVAELGVGVPFLTVKQLKNSLAGALVKLTTDEDMQVKARALGEQIRSQDGVTKAVEAFHMELNRHEQRRNENK